MKKFLFSLMLGALAMPMISQVATMTKAEALARMDRSQKEEITPLKSNDLKALPRAVQNRGGMYVWDFETDDQLSQWSMYDADGDGYCWETDDYYSYGGGSISLTSRSYYGGALDPDNWLISPIVSLDGVLSIFTMNYSSYWPDKIAIYVCVGQPESVADFEKISGDIISPSTWTEQTFDLTAYQGQEGCIAIRHFECYDNFRVYVDYVSLGVPEPPVPDPTVPENVAADPGENNASITWADEDDSMWNLRYRLYDPETTQSFFEDFENQGVTGDPVAGGWTVIDANGDGYTWYIFDPVYSGYESADGVRMFGNKCATSPSYMGGALYPDNWLISPQVTLKDQLSFWACGQDPDYASEHFAVYVTTGDPADLASYVQVTDELIASYPIQEYVVDLSQFEGQQGYVAFRHFNVSDQFRLNVDNVKIGNPGPEWIYVNDINELNYVIEGLDAETTYEVQVQATNGDKTSEWSESVLFTTLPAAGPEPTEKTGAPTFHGYTEDGIHAYFVEIIPTEPSVIYYRVQFPDGTWTEWAEYEDILSFTGDGKYRVEAYAVADGKLKSEDIAYEFVVAPLTGIEEMNADKPVAGVRYYNAMGQEMQQAEGLTIVVTTYTDGTTSAVKVVK